MWEQKIKMKTVLVTGAYGQMGEACRKHLKNNFNLIMSGISPVDNGVKLDITSQDSVTKVLSDSWDAILCTI